MEWLVTRRNLFKYKINSPKLTINIWCHVSVQVTPVRNMGDLTVSFFFVEDFGEIRSG